MKPESQHGISGKVFLEKPYAFNDTFGWNNYNSLNSQRRWRCKLVVRAGWHVLWGKKQLDLLMIWGQIWQIALMRIFYSLRLFQNGPFWNFCFEAMYYLEIMLFLAGKKVKNKTKWSCFLSNKVPCSLRTLIMLKLCLLNFYNRFLCKSICAVLIVCGLPVRGITWTQFVLQYYMHLYSEL